VSQEEGYDALVEAERLLSSAEDNPDAARAAAQSALRALLLEWGETPRAETVAGLLEQAARTDDTLMEFHAEAEVLDRFNPAPDAADRARIFIDAARARLVNI
jgi:HEPN domain-containing protein